MATSDDGGPAGNVLTRLIAWLTDLLHRERARHPWLDHAVHAGGRYNRAQSNLLASGVTYYVFLALFPVILLVASIASFVLAGVPALQSQLVVAVRDAIPGGVGDELADQVTRAIGARGATGVIGLVGFVYVGLRAMDMLRVGMDIVWRGVPDPPSFLADRGRDLLALLGLAAAATLSIALTTGATAASNFLLELLGIDQVPGFFLLTAALGIGLALAGDTLVFLWLLKGVPRTPYRARMLLPGAVFGAVGIEALKFVGGYYLTLLSGSATASAFGGLVGVIIWINVVARFAFFTAAWTATLPAVERNDAEVFRRPGGTIPAPVDEPVDRSGQQPADDPARGLAPVPLAAGLLGAGAVAGAVGSRLLPRWRRRRRTRERDG